MRAAAIQLNSTPDADRNLAAADRLVRACGAELVVLPEKWPLLGTPEETVAHDPSEAARWAAAIAKELGIHLVAGSWSEDGFNTSVHFGPAGEVARYRKIHLFDVVVGDTTYSESRLEQPGSDIVVSSAGPVELGLTICYDLRFPELYRSLAVAGATVFPIPAAFTVPTTRDHWEVLLRARAIEDQCFVVAANQIGRAGEGGPQSGGRSMIVDPWGVVLACAPDSETFVVADLDLDAQTDVRRKIPSLANRVLV
ncbi:MAG: deaminated glutathione amidase [Solirubrobacteraceae bacterium]|nr:deaminated glutathione amidase [Solirubrobacteraceae bacterium]